MRKYFIYCTLLAALVLSCERNDSQRRSTFNPVKYIDLRLNDNRDGAVAAPVVSPFGEITLSPYIKKSDESRPGRAAGESFLYGFRNGLASNTNAFTGGNILIMPVFGDLEFPAEKRKSSISLEAAQPGYYKAKLDRYGIFAEMTATPHTGLYQYHFQDGWAHVIVDLSAPPPFRGGMIRFNGPTEMQGYTWQANNDNAERRKIWFAIRFSRAAMGGGLFKDGQALPREASIVEGERIGAYFSYRTLEGDVVHVKTALSENSAEEAFSFLDREQPTWSFPLVRQRARERWQQELAKIMVYSDDDDMKRLFYTALYNSVVAATLAENSPDAESLLSAIEKLYCLGAGERKALADIELSAASMSSGGSARAIRDLILKHASAPGALLVNDRSAAWSSWLVWTMMGLAPDCQQGGYALLAPLFKRIEIALDDGAFTIAAPRAGQKAIRLKAAKLNGVKKENQRLLKEELRAGGSLSVKTVR